jgi:hypothetical protein
MNEEQAQELVRMAERYAARMSFGCSHECREDFYFHAQALIDYLTAIIEYEFWAQQDDLPVLDLPYPHCPCHMTTAFDAEGTKFRKRMEDYLCAA